MVRADLPGVEGLHHQRRQGRGRGGVRAVGLGQVDADQMRQRAGAVSGRPDHPRRHQGQRSQDRSAETARPRRHGVPAFRAVSAFADHRESVPGAGEGAGPLARRGDGQGREAARARRVDGACEQIPGRTVRRPAAARGDRARAGDGPDRDAVRRADLGARSGNDQRGARRHGRSCPRGHDHDGRHPRDGLCQQGRAIA